MSDQGAALVHQLADAEPALKDLLTEHLDDNNGDLLTHVYFGALTRWVTKEITDDPGAAAAQHVLTMLDDAAATGDDDVVNLITVSFLENLDDDSPVLGQLSPRLRDLRDEDDLDDD